MQETKLGEGRAAEVFALPDHRVVKLYRAGGQAARDHELRLARLAWDLGVPSPRPWEGIEIGGRCGIVFERVDAPSMLTALTENPMLIRRCAHQMAALHARMHAQPVPAARQDGLTRVKDTLRGGISRAGLDAPREAAVLRVLDALPDGDRLCHMDFHPDNVLMAAPDGQVIDWPNACLGAPEADVCNASVTICIGSTLESTPEHLRRAMDDFRQSLDRQYLAEYLRLQGGDAAGVAAWQAPVAAARLGTGIAGEREPLLALIDAGI